MDGADWLRTQLTSVGCASCGRAYAPSHIRIIAERDGLFFVDLGCAACGSQAVAVVTVQVEDDTARGADAGEPMPAVHDPADAPRAGAEPVTVDDLLAMHDFLAGYQGDLVSLVRPGKSDGA